MIPALNEYGALSHRVLYDPRLSRSQKDAIRRAAAGDPTAKVEGLDENMRPVVCARATGPGGRTRWALLRNGDPARAARIAEAWQ